MTPLHEHVNQVFGDLAFGKKHLEDLVPVEDPVFSGEDLFQVFQLEQGRYMEHVISIETSVGAKYVQMRMPPKEIAK